MAFKTTLAPWRCLGRPHHRTWSIGKQLIDAEEAEITDLQEAWKTTFETLKQPQEVPDE